MAAIIHFDIDGWYARRDGDFTCENVARIVDSAARIWRAEHGGATVYVAYDTRQGAREAAEHAASILSARGLCAVLSHRSAPTAALSWTIAQDGAACGGIMVTGSHCPDDYLGIKLRCADGGIGPREFTDEVERGIEAAAPEGDAEYSERDIVGPYLDSLLSLIDVDLIAGAGLSVVCDPMYGPARGYLAGLLAEMGVRVLEIHGSDDEGRAELRPQAIEPWVDDCEQVVEECDAHAGLVIDGDANLVGAIDSDGKYIGSDKVASLILGHLVINRGLSGRVVTSVAASSRIRSVARGLGCRVAMRPLGFRYIYEDACRGSVLMGTEGFGGICVPSHSLERDGMLACLLLCELMAQTGKDLKNLVQELEDGAGSYYCGRRDLRLPMEDVEVLRTMMPGMNPRRVSGLAPSAVSHMDGLRLEFADESWLLIRPSRIEPIVRVYAEARSIERKDVLVDAACDIARGITP